MIEVEKVDEEGQIYFFIKGTKILHREDGPAFISIRVKEWWINGKLHRVGGPAIIDADGSEEWWVNGKLHREDGPAQVYCDTFFWYLNGIRLPTREGWFEALPEDGRLKLLYSENFIRG